jgi:hypothetical protein
MKKQEQIDALRFRIERIEAKLAEQHKGNNFGKLAEHPEPDYTRPLPTGLDWKKSKRINPKLK